MTGSCSLQKRLPRGGCVGTGAGGGGGGQEDSRALEGAVSQVGLRSGKSLQSKAGAASAPVRGPQTSLSCLRSLFPHLQDEGVVLNYF